MVLMDVDVTDNMINISSRLHYANALFIIYFACFACLKNRFSD